MACLDAAGILTASGRRLLGLLSEPRSPVEIAAAAGMPLYRVRSSLREMVEAGLVVERSGNYLATEAGASKAADRT
jgi:predicted transcriptional regulator